MVIKVSPHQFSEFLDYLRKPGILSNQRKGRTIYLSFEDYTFVLFCALAFSRFKVRGSRPSCWILNNKGLSRDLEFVKMSMFFDSLGIEVLNED